MGRSTGGLTWQPDWPRPPELRKNVVVKIMTAAPAPSADQDATTRRRVMRYVMEHSGATSAGLAEAFGVTPAAIRRHLSFLQESGMLAVRPHAAVRKGAGRPAKEWVATARGREWFSHAYDDFAVSAVETLLTVGGRAAVVAFFEARFAAVEARFAEVRAAQPWLSEAEALSQALSEDGFMAGLVPMARGEQLCQHNCPYPAVAARFPDLCLAETAVFSRLLGSHVQRLATIAHGDGVCTTNIPALTVKEDR